MEIEIKESTSIAQVTKKVFGYDNAHSRKKVNEFINENNVDISHFGKKKIIERVVKVCPVCKKKFETKLNHRDEKITCSHSCSNSFFRSGINNPNWKNDRYQSTCWEFHEKKCIICGEEKIVAVHHHDENRENNSPENLIPLCPTHHHYVHSKFRNLVIDQIENYIYNFKKNAIRNSQTDHPYGSTSYNSRK
jgi:hypothetical protein